MKQDDGRLTMDWCNDQSSIDLCKARIIRLAKAIGMSVKPKR